MRIFKYRSTPIAFVIWLVFLWLLHTDVVSQSFLTKDAYIDINDGALIMRQDYMGFYLGNKKIGFSRYILKEDHVESKTRLPGKYYLFESNSFLQIEALGMPITLKMHQAGEVNEDLSLRNFSFSYEASGQKLTVFVDVQDDGLHITTKSEQDTSNTIIPNSGDIYHADMIHLLVARDGLEIGKSYSYPVFEAMTMSFSNVEIKVLDKEKLKLPNGTVADTYKLDINLKGIQTTSWINEAGDVFKEISSVIGITSTAVRETREEAENMDFVSKEVLNQPAPEMDLIKASKIAVDKPINNPNKVKSMDIKLIGAATGDVVIDNTFQSLLSQGDDHLVLRIKKQDYKSLTDSLPAETAPYAVNDDENQKYLKEESLVQSNNPLIIEKAREITRDAANRWQAARAIGDWLYLNINKEMRVTIPSAVEVLASMKGDCNEHSTLFAALSRAIGLPAKVCAGLVYQGDGFYYHAWNEVFIAGRWIPIDATLNRIEMDAAHIKLAEGSLDAQTDIVNLIGKLNVEVISVDY